MSDKSPRQSLGKKSSQTLKQKRAAKRAKAEHTAARDDALKPKRH
ncbi:hypothetical protein [Mycobacterium gastri]|nr:hypothetical protein [Mycobacterium gastri]